MTNFFQPFLIFFIFAFLCLIGTKKLCKFITLSAPILSAISVNFIKKPVEFVLMNHKIILFQIDKINFPFFYAFLIISFLGILYNIHRDDKKEIIFPMLYAGSAMGVLFTGDFLSLFFFWELMAIFSTVTVWLGGNEKSKNAGLRYLLIHLAGGFLFLVGIVLLNQEMGDLQFTTMNKNSYSSWLILTAVLINAAVPPFSAWLSDAYPESSIGGTVFLSAFTTKTAVYLLCKFFAGWEVLIYLGAFMAVYGVIYAFMVLNIRRLLSYHIISQVGFMVTGVGIGTALALNGTISHAFTHIIYKGLLMMSAGVIFYATQKERLNELGGLFGELKIVFIFYMIGALSISGFPLLSGFVSKSITITASLENHNLFAWIMLNIASVGTLISVSLKLPYLAFFGEMKVQNDLIKVPQNMKLAMFLSSVICVVIGIFPKLLYSILPFDMAYTPYTAEHVIFVLQMFLGAFIAFVVYSKHLDAKYYYIVLDTDWFYRKGLNFAISLFNEVHDEIISIINKIFYERMYNGLCWFIKNPLSALKIILEFFLVLFGTSSKEKELKRIISKYPQDTVKHWPIGTTILYSSLLLMIFLIIYYMF